MFGGLRSEPRLLIFTNNQKCGRNDLPKARVITLLQELAPKEGGDAERTPALAPVNDRTNFVTEK